MVYLLIVRTINIEKRNFMKHNPMELKVQINALGYCPEGIGKVVDSDLKDMTVFVENTVPGELVEVETFRMKKSYLRANLKEILEESDKRVKPECPYAKICGGCQWQHVDYNYQLEAKTQTVKDSLKKIAGFDADIVKPTLRSPEIWNYRAKVQFPLDITKNSQRLLIGYYKRKSHEIINIKFCPVQPEEFNKIIEKLRDLHKDHFLRVYNEKTFKGYLRHFILRKSFSENKILITFVVNSNYIDPELIELSKELMKVFPQITGATVNFNTSKSNVIFGENSELIAGEPYIIEKIEDKSYKISDRSFFQVNPHSAKIMFNTIREIVQNNNGSGNLIDIYAGGSAFSIYLADLFDNIIAIESEPSCLDDAKENFKMNNINNINFINKPASKAIREIDSSFSADWVILDPPRSGSDEDVLELCSKLQAKNIIYVSCNPTTFARDLKILIEKGYEPVSIQPIDMFCHTYHVESVSYLKKVVK